MKWGVGEVESFGLIHRKGLFCPFCLLVWAKTLPWGCSGEKWGKTPKLSGEATGDPAMAGFKGQAENKIDDKGRVALPAKMRRALSPEAKETFVATRGMEQCVFLYPQDVWEQIEEQIENLNPFQRETRDFVRKLYRWAEDTTLDAQGRISLPKTLVDFAGLSVGNGASALFIGAHDHIEIWDPQVFDDYLNAQPDTYETVAERVMGGL